MQREYAERYADLYRRHWWWRAREDYVLDVLSRRRPSGGWNSILDVGCGDGLFFDRLRSLGSSVEGVEPDAGIVSEETLERHTIHLGPFDATFLPAKRYDLILMLDVLEHMDDPSGALRHAASLLTREGAVLITVPAFRLLWTSHDDMNEHRTRYKRKELMALVRGADLHASFARYFFHWLFPVKLAIRLAEAVARRPVSSPSLPPESINAMFQRASSLERRLLERWRLPLGSSLLVLAAPDRTSR